MRRKSRIKDCRRQRRHCLATFHCRHCRLPALYRVLLAKRLHLFRGGLDQKVTGETVLHLLFTPSPFERVQAGIPRVRRIRIEVYHDVRIAIHESDPKLSTVIEATQMCAVLDNDRSITRQPREEEILDHWSADRNVYSSPTGPGISRFEHCKKSSVFVALKRPLFEKGRAP